MENLTAKDILGYDYEETHIIGSRIVRVYKDMYSGDVSYAETLYEGETPEDAVGNLMRYWRPPVSWYISNRGELTSLEA